MSKNARRIQGSGSIYQQKDGRWRGFLTLGRDENGKQVRTYVSGKTRKEVNEKLEVKKREHQAGLLASSKRQTVGQYLSQWLEDVVKVKNAKATYDLYKNTVDVHLSPLIGHVQLAKLSPGDLQRAYRQKTEAAGGATRTVELMHTTLRNALNVAVKWRLIVRNPALDVEAPRSIKREMVCWTSKEAKQFLAAAHAAGDRYYCLYVLLLSTGLRIGEALALRWTDLDWDNGLIMIQRTLSRGGGKYDFSEPKTALSRRALVLPSMTLDALQVHRREQVAHRLKLGQCYEDQDLVFATEYGGPLNPSNIRNRSFNPLIEKTLLPKITLHGLRHTAATSLLAAGVDLKRTSEMLGHASIKITADVYSHVNVGMQRETAATMDALLGGSASTKATS